MGQAHRGFLWKIARTGARVIRFQPGVAASARNGLWFGIANLARKNGPKLQKTRFGSRGNWKGFVQVHRT